MSDPHVPGAIDQDFELPCGQTVSIDRFDLGMREFQCACGDAHAVVVDPHPLSRWIPESVSSVLRETVVPTDEYDEFGTIHLMGMVLEEFPDQLAVSDASDDPSVGWALLWVTAFDARTLHEIIVELLVELMDHAVSHGSEAEVRADFSSQLEAFDIESFVTAYRETRDFDAHGDHLA